MQSLTFRVSLASLVLASIGCGGGGSGPAVLAETTANAGSFQLKGQLRAPNFTSTVGASVYAVSGTITKAVLNDANPTLEETEILASIQDNQGSRIVAVGPNGQGRRTIVNGTCDKIQCTASWVYFLQGTTLWRVPLSGGSPTSLKTNVTDFALSYDGTKVAYRLSTPAGYYFANGDGTSQTLINTDPTAYELLGGLTTNTIICVNRTTNTIQSLNLAAAASFSSMFAIVNPGVATWHPWTGTLVYRNMTSGNYERIRIASPTVWGSGTSYPNTVGVGSIAVGPTGGRLVGSAANQVSIQNIGDGTSNTVLFGEAQTGPVWWGPYVLQRQFVPTSTYSSGAAAIVFSELGNRVPAVVLADATTRASMTTTKVSVDGSTNVVYRLDCDQLTKLHYSKGGGFALQNIVTSPTGLKGVYVSINAETGEAASLLTYTNRPTETRRGNNVILKGDGLEMILLSNERARRPVPSVTL